MTNRRTNCLNVLGGGCFVLFFPVGAFADTTLQESQAALQNGYLAEYSSDEYSGAVDLDSYTNRPQEAITASFSQDRLNLSLRTSLDLERVAEVSGFYDHGLTVELAAMADQSKYITIDGEASVGAAFNVADVSGFYDDGLRIVAFAFE